MVGPYALDMVHCGDSLALLRRLPDKCINTCVTSPPYWGLRDYGLPPTIWGGNSGCWHQWNEEELITNRSGGFSEKQCSNAGAYNPDGINSKYGFCSSCGAWRGCFGLEPTPKLFVEHIVLIFQEVKRVLRDDGTLWLNLGDSYSGSWARSANPGGIDNSPMQCGNKGSYVKDGQCTITPAGLKPKDLCGIPWRVAFALQAAGWYLRSDIIWHKPNPMPESIKDRPTKAHEYLFLMSKSARYYYDCEAIMEERDSNEKRADGVCRELTYGDKCKQNLLHKRTYTGFNARWDKSPTAKRNRRSVWTIATAPYKGAHFATFPPKLIEPCILAGTSEKGCCPECGSPWERIVERLTGFSKECPKTQAAHDARGGTGTPKGTVGKSGGGRTDGRSKTIGWQPTCSCPEHEPVPCTVLDPFAGSGTTGIVAIKHGRRFLGFDLNQEYCDTLSNPRLAAATQGLTLKEYEAGQLPLF